MVAAGTPARATAVSERTRLAAADIAEYRRRLEEARTLMRAHRFDALVVGSGPPTITSPAISVGSHGRFAQPRYHRWFSGFHIFGAESFGAQPVVVVLPLDGEPALVVRAGTLGSWAALARAHSWIDTVVATYRDDEEWEESSNWGLSSPELPADVAQALADGGVGSGRIGLVGSWPGLEETMALVPDATFEPTLTLDDSGGAVDLLAPLLAGNSRWEIAQLERAQVAADAAMRAYIDVAAEGVTIDRAVAEARYRAGLSGAEDAFFEITCGTDAWSLWVAPNQAPGARFRPGELITVSANTSVNGYWVQMPRTWLLGRPSREQRRVFETARRALDAMLALVAPGVTGGELWDAALSVIDEAGYQPRGRVGHSIGFTAVTGPEVFSMLPGNDVPLEDSMAFVIHPCVCARSTGIAVQLGDSLVMEDGRWRFLSSDVVPHDPGTWS